MLERMSGYCAVYPREEFISSPKRAKGDVGESRAKITLHLKNSHPCA